MATFKVVPDKRYTRKDHTHRYCLRTTVEGEVVYLQLKMKLTPSQHNLVFKGKSMSADCIHYREQISALERKAEKIYQSMKRYDPDRFKQLFFDQGGHSAPPDPTLPQTLAVKGLFEYYISNAPIKLGTQIHMGVVQRMLEAFHPGLYLDDIDVAFLKEFEKTQFTKGKSISTVASYMRDTRTIINYFRLTKKIVPSDYQYPFGRGGYSIKTVRKKKMVLREEEISTVIEAEHFDSPQQEYARNIWVCLYYGCGMNPIDLIRLRWDQVEEMYAHYIRTKTETTRKSNIQELVLPMTEDFRYSLDLVAGKKGPFVLGLIKEGYTETSLRNRKNRFRNDINTQLKKLSSRLNLSVPLTMSTARDCYASTLNRNGVSRESISGMLGHNDPRTTAAYLASLSVDETFAINKHLVKRKKKPIEKKGKKDTKGNNEDGLCEVA